MQRFQSSAVRVEDNGVDAENGPVPTAASRVETSKTVNRLMALDLMRGLIMIIMSWDHTKDIWVNDKWSAKHSGREGWQGNFASFDNNWWLWAARTVSNLCAPGFFYTMGISMALFTVNRLASGWPSSEIVYHFVVRGAFLVFCDRLVNAPFDLGTIVKVLKGETIPASGWGPGYSPENEGRMFADAFLSVFEVMTGLGLTMISAIPLLLFCHWLYVAQVKKETDSAEVADEVTWTQSAEQALLANAQDTSVSTQSSSTQKRFQWVKVALWDSITWAELAAYVVFVIIYAVDNVVIVKAQGDDFWLAKNASFPDYGYRASSFVQVLERYFILPGNLPLPLGGASYPVIPWIAMTSLGIGMGFSLNKNTTGTISRMAFISAFFLVGFVFIRLFGGKVGNYRGLPRGDGRREGFVQVDDLLAFFITSKYPPSLAYCFLFLGTDIFFIFAFFQSMSYYPFQTEGWGWRRVPQFFWDSCNIYGQVPLFFYLVHFWILGPAAAVACAFTDNYKVSLPACVLIWLTLLSILRPLCLRYGQFKQTTAKNSLWRLL